jgi:uncharacterized membrane protein
MRQLLSAYDLTERRLRIAAIVICTIGIGVGSYLTFVHYYGLNSLVCTNTGCLTVQSSVYSKVGGVPVALIGLIGYVLIMASLLAPASENARLSTMALTLGGFGFSAYLTYREIFSIKAICEWCVSSFVIVFLLLCLSVARYIRGDARLPSPPPEPAAEAAAAGEPDETRVRAVAR